VSRQYNLRGQSKSSDTDAFIQALWIAGRHIRYGKILVLYLQSHRCNPTYCLHLQVGSHFCLDDGDSMFL
jgi:hypothetical protein